MSMPAWNDPDFTSGSMVRGALWLVQVIGEGNTFTKSQLRDAFPGVAQADRRIRDLRDYGWVLHSNTEDASLLAEDQRFVKMGVAVWDPKARRAAAPQKAITSKQRQAALARDHYMCTLCGIAGGEDYPDDTVMTAVLAVSRRKVVSPDGNERVALVTECKRCRSGRGDATLSITEFLDAAGGLDAKERRRLLRWMERGRRGATPLDRAWSAYLRVPLDERERLGTRIREAP